MNLKEAMNVLEFDNIIDITLENLKRKYHSFALKYHQDKNGNTNESKEMFQKIKEAYDVLKREISVINNEEESNVLNNLNETSGYTTILNLFIDSIMKGKYNSFISNIIKDIVNGCKDISLKLFEDMNKEHSLMIYNFLIKYKSILHLSDETIEKVKDILLEKFKDLQIYILNPSLHDLFQNNIYKLQIHNKIYFVPLWHNELYFDCDDGSDLIVKCNPELPENVIIDEDNNIIITEQFSFTSSLLNQKYIFIKLGELLLSIPVDQLLIKQVQTYIFKGQGISQINEHDCIDNDSKKSDIIVRIYFI